MYALLLAASLLSAPHPVATEALRAAPGPQHHAALATDGRDFFAAWEHKSSALAGAGDVVGTRITAGGDVVDAAGAIPLLPSWVSDTSPAVVWNGTTYVIVFTRGPQPWPYGLKAVELSTDGRIVNDREFVAPRDVQFVDVAWNGSAYLVTWVQDQMSEVRAVMLDRTLTPITSEVVLDDGVIDEIAAASNGTTFGVAWRTREASYFAEILAEGVPGAAIEVAGVVDGIDVASNGDDYVVFAGDVLVMPGGLRVPMPDGSGQAVAWNGAHYVAAWSANDRVWSAELDAALHVTREPSRVTSRESLQVDPAIAGDLLAWTDTPLDSPYLSDIRAALIGGTTFLVSSSVADQRPADAVWAHGNLAMLWHEGDGAAESLRFGLMTPGGSLLSGDGVALRRAPVAQLASNGDVFMVVSVREHDSIEIERLDANGTPLGEPRHVATGSQVRIASDGRDFLILYASTSTGALTTMHVSADGIPGTTAELPLLLIPGATRMPREALWTGSEYVVVYAEALGRFSSTYAIGSTRIAGDGTRGETHTIFSGSGTAGAAIPFAATNGSDVLYVWTLGNSVYTQLGDTGPPSLLANDAFVEDASWDGSQFVIILGHGDATRTLIRGAERIAFDMTPWTVYASGYRRVAIMEMRAVQRIPGLHDLDVWRASVRFLGNAKRRSGSAGVLAG